MSLNINRNGKNVILEDQDEQDFRNSLPVIDILVEQRASATLSAKDFKLALLDAGLLDTIEAAIDDPGTDRKIKIMWDNAQSFDRLYPELLAMATQLSITDIQMDAVFGIGE